MSADKYTVYAAPEAGKPFEKREVDMGPLGDDEVELKIESCGICRSDVNMWKNDWKMSQYPFVGGHEGFGTVSRVGKNVTHLKEGQRAGLGWHSKYCRDCKQCLKGEHNLCQGAGFTIGGRHGCWADKVRAQGTAVVPVPEGLNGDFVGPLLCGGVTVFGPISEYAHPSMKVGVIGIGGLGSMAIQFASKWGCHVTAFTSSESKTDFAKKLGAHDVLLSTSDDQLKKAAGQFDMIINTVEVKLNWELIIGALAPRGRLHLCGALEEPIPVAGMPMIMAHRTISASPVGSPAMLREMMEFAKRHEIKPEIKTYKMEEINKALEELDKGKPHGRIVLKW